MKTVEVFSLMNLLSGQKPNNCAFTNPLPTSSWPKETWDKLGEIVKTFQSEIEEEEEDSYEAKRKQDIRTRAKTMSSDDIALDIYLALYIDADHLFDRTKQEVIVLFEELKQKVRS